MSREWYYAKEKQKTGPISSVQLKALAKSGALKPTDLVWTEGMKDWTKAGSVKGLIPPSQIVPPPVKTATPVKPTTASTPDDAIGGFVEASPKQPWYCHWAIFSLTTLLCFPATLILVWWKSTYSKAAKWAWTAACLVTLYLITRQTSERQANPLPHEQPPPMASTAPAPSQSNRTEPNRQPLIPSHTLANESGKWGFINRDGENVFSRCFDDARLFSDGLAAVKRNEKWGYIDHSGALLIPFTYDEGTPFSDGVSKHQGSGNEGGYCIDKNGKRVTVPVGEPHFVQENGLWGLKDSSGKYLIQPRLFFPGTFWKGVAIVTVAGSWGMVDTTGRFLLPLQKRIMPVEPLPYEPYVGSNKGNDSSQCLITFIDMEETVFGYLDNSGQIAIPARFGGASPFSEGLACVSVGMRNSDIRRQNEQMAHNPMEFVRSSTTSNFGKTGYIDESGQFVIEPRFKGGESFSEGLAAVCEDKSGKKWGFIDKHGNLVIPFSFDNRPGRFQDGLADVEVGDRTGFMDRKGRVVIKPAFKKTMGFSEGVATVQF